MLPARAISKIKGLVPESVAAAFGNCGGSERRRARFAANLLRADLDPDEYLRICHSLIFPNGVRKTTAAGRNADVIRRLLDAGELVRKPRVRVLEVGASVGLDALETWKLLQARCAVDRYDLGDLYTEIRYDPARGLIFDQDGELLQVDLGSRFVAMHFAYNYPFQRWTNLPKRLRPWLLRRRYRRDPGARTISIPLVHPDVPLGRDGAPFELKRMSVFDPVPERYDLVICMHLLVERYFDRATIEAGVQNLASALAPGGTLVVGAKERFRVIKRGEDGRGLQVVESSAPQENGGNRR